MIGRILDIAGDLLDRLIPDPKEKAEAKARLLELAQRGELRELELRMQAIVAEAQSGDRYVARARPTFLYVMYVMLLAAIPYGFMWAFVPDVASRVAEGFGAWLHAIPDSLYALFGAGYLGYAAARTTDKIKGKS